MFENVSNSKYITFYQPTLTILISSKNIGKTML